jgi:hypothetical protein
MTTVNGSTPFDYFATTKTETYDKDKASSTAETYFLNDTCNSYNKTKKWYQRAFPIQQTLGQSANNKADKKDNQTAASIMLKDYANKLEIPETDISDEYFREEYDNNVEVSGTTNSLLIETYNDIEF